MKVIFSRKGFDSAAGGCPSPIINGSPVSLPIPTTKSCLTYGDLNGSYSDLVSDLTPTRHKLTAQDLCHLDPDINSHCRNRPQGWRGALGQVSASQSHLANQQVKPGDLFVFWGLFQPAEKIRGSWKFVGEREHRIWGWLQIDEIIKVEEDRKRNILQQHPWLKDHAHIRHIHQSGGKPGDFVYVARQTLSTLPLLKTKAGFGVLQKGYRLTALGESPSIWNVPNWLNPKTGGCGMTYHPEQRWSDNGLLQAAPRGQEFVTHTPVDQEGREWLAGVIEERADG